MYYLHQYIHLFPIAAVKNHHQLSDLKHKCVISQCVGSLAEYMAGFFAHSHGCDAGLAGVVI